MKLNQLKCPKCKENTISYACSKGAGATCFYFCNDPSCGILITAGPASNLSGLEGSKDFEIKEKIEEINEKKQEINKNTEEIKEELKEFNKDTQDEIFEMAKEIKKEKQSAGGGNNSILAKIKNDKSFLKDKTKSILKFVKCKQCGENNIRFLSEKSLIARMDTGWKEAKTVYYCEICKSLITIGPAFSSEILADAADSFLSLFPGSDLIKTSVAAGVIYSVAKNNENNRLNGLICSNCEEKTLDVMSSAGFGATAFYYCNNPKCGVLIGTAPSSKWIREKSGIIRTININGEEKKSISGKIMDKRSLNFENKSKTILRELSCPKCITDNNDNLRIDDKPAGKIVPKGYSGIMGRIGMIGTSVQTQYICNKCKSLISIGPAFSLIGGSKKNKKTFKKKRKHKRTNKRINKRTKRIKNKTKRKKR